MDHVFIISSGFIYFWIIPLTFYHYNILSDKIKEIDFARELGFKNIELTDERTAFYLIIIFCILLTRAHVSIFIEYPL